MSTVDTNFHIENPRPFSARKAFIRHHRLMMRTIIVLLGSTGIVIGGTVSLAKITDLSFDAQIGLWCVVATGIIGIISSVSVYYYAWRYIGERLRDAELFGVARGVVDMTASAASILSAMHSQDDWHNSVSNVTSNITTGTDISTAQERKQAL